MLQLPAVGGPWVTAYVAFTLVMHLLEQYLEVRQLAKNNEAKVPTELKGQVDEEEFKKSQVYQKDKRIFGFVRSWTMFFWGLVCLFVVQPLTFNIAAGVMGTESEYKVTLFWLFIQQWVDKPLEIPFSIYSNFVVEAKHGFNKMTYATFFSDLVKSELLTYFFGGLLIPMLIWIVRHFGERFYLYLWAAFQALIFAMMWIYPNFIQPIFNKFEVLKDEVLRTQIEELAAGLKFPLTKLFQIDGSKRSSHSNAYFFGFWKWKRIVLYDTLLHLTHEDILGILCHELGHWKHGHTLMNLVISSAHIFVLFWLFGTVMYSGSTSQDMIRQFGYGEAQAVMVSLMVFTMLYSPTEQVLRLLMTMLSRRFEYQADAFAVTQGRGEALKNGLLQIHKENKGDLNPDEWYSWYHFSHPPLVERIRAVDGLTKSAGNKKAD